MVVDVRQWHQQGGWPVTLTTTPCHLGGVRYWFVCPECSRRALKLYQAAGYLACRLCHGLNYRAQHENPFDRALSKAQRIRMRLGGSANMTLPFPPKPKNMRWSKYYKLANVDQASLMKSLTGLRAWLDSMKKSLR